MVPKGAELGLRTNFPSSPAVPASPLHPNSRISQSRSLEWPIPAAPCRPPPLLPDLGLLAQTFSQTQIKITRCDALQGQEVRTSSQCTVKHFQLFSRYFISPFVFKFKRATLVSLPILQERRIRKPDQILNGRQTHKADSVASSTPPPHPYTHSHQYTLPLKWIHRSYTETQNSHVSTSP